MTTKDMVKNFKKLVSMTDHMFLNEVETREGFRNYKITVFIKVNKDANLDVEQVFSKIRGIPGVITLKQEKAVSDRVTYLLCEVTIKFNSRGVPNKNYIYDILVKQINSEIETQGIPGTKVYGINWQSFSEI
jgi:hypothetical protein